MAVMKRAPNSASDAEVRTYLMVWAIVRTAPFHFGVGSSSERKMWDPARLCPFDSLLKPTSEWADKIMSLA